MGRKSLLRPTQKKPQKSKATGSLEEAKRKKAVIDAVEKSSDSVKATLKDLGLAKSTYYKWVKAYKKKGLKGLEKGGPVAPRVWQRVTELDKGEKSPIEDSKLPVEETETMKSDDERTKELLFRKFDDGPKKAAERAPETVSETPSAPSHTPPPEEPMDKTVRYAILGFGAVVAILLLASLSNSNNFYFKQNDQMVELWQGRFAPMGECLVSSFSDAKIFYDL